ncbi:hypothetical protein RCH18_000884 [Flavobacterium sp. PL11]|uniref:hypothetical protein n=1 Tax=Flavobacterium sp. PL11 TaxID=3071717 RepID=UPI002E0046EA|nr:hypothetical protein [Flavobacterium sp. PL11]
MKKLLFIIFMSFTNFAISQNVNFKIDNGLINWKNVYSDSLNTLQLKNNQLLEFKTDSTGFVKKTNFNDKKLRQLTAEFKIETQKNKYRVTVFNVKFYAEPMNLYGGGLSMQTVTEYSIEQSLIKSDGSIRKTYMGYNLTETLNPHLVNLFTIKKQESKNW